MCGDGLQTICHCSFNLYTQQMAFPCCEVCAKSDYDEHSCDGPIATKLTHTFHSCEMIRGQLCSKLYIPLKLSKTTFIIS